MTVWSSPVLHIIGWFVVGLGALFLPVLFAVGWRFGWPYWMVRYAAVHVEFITFALFAWLRAGPQSPSPLIVGVTATVAMEALWGLIYLGNWLLLRGFKLPPSTKARGRR